MIQGYQFQDGKILCRDCCPDVPNETVLFYTHESCAFCDDCGAEIDTLNYVG